MLYTSRTIKILAVAAGCVAVLFGNTAVAEPETGDVQADSAYTDLALLPIAFYTPETGMALGAAGAYFFKPHPESRPSSVSAIMFYSQRGNLLIGVEPELYARDGSRRILFGLSYENFPQSFWGVGGDTDSEMEEDYTSRAVYFSFLAQKRFYPGMRVGMRYRFRYERMTDVEEDRGLSAGDLPGTDEHIISGLGIVPTWDSRDNIYFARSGTFVELLAMYYADILGSDYEFTRLSLDVKWFTRLVGEHSLALRAVTTAAAGDVPFQDLPRLGGAYLMRGYNEGRYRDEARLIFQAEYRSAYWWRLGMVVFGSYGDVAPGLGDLDVGSFKYSAGFGLRFRLNEEDYNVRFDFGFAEGSSGFYFMAGEAF